MSFLCKLGIHNYLQSQKGDKAESWHKICYGIELPCSKYGRFRSTIVEKCSRCDREIAFRRYQDRNPADYEKLDVEFAKAEIEKLNRTKK